MKHQIVLGRRTPLGGLQFVTSVTPVDVVRKDDSSGETKTSLSEHESSPVCLVKDSGADEADTELMEKDTSCSTG